MQLDYVQCVGTEARLADCPSGTVSSRCPTHAYDAGVRCSAQTSKLSLVCTCMYSRILMMYYNNACVHVQL